MRSQCASELPEASRPQVTRAVICSVIGKPIHSEPGRGVMRALAGACAVRRRRCRLTLHLATVRAWEATTSELSHTKSRPEHRAAPCARGHHRASAQHSQHGGVPDRAQPPGYCVPSCRNLVTAGRPSFSQGPKRAPQKQLASEQKGTADRRVSCVYRDLLLF